MPPQPIRRPRNKVRRVALSALLALGVVIVVLLAYIRLAPHDIARWHVDPVTASLPPTPNARILRPGAGAETLPVPPERLAAIVAEVASAQPRTRLLAGEPGGMHTTWLQRSRLLGYPDYVSIRVLPAEGGASLALFSRSRYGHSDLGVNAARAEEWMAAITERARAD